jgi:hypothetical protein
VRKPAYRLGQGACGTADIKRHAWFAGFDWEAFAAKKLKAPYMPVVRGTAYRGAAGCLQATACAMLCIAWCSCA